MKKSAFSSEIQNGIIYLAKNDRVLKKIINKTETCSLRPHRYYYLSLLRAIIGQQLSISAASSIYNRFTNEFSNLPTPEQIVNSPDPVLRKIGLSNAKAKYVKDLSSKLLNKELKLAGFRTKNDEEIISELTKVKGIGLWTSQMFLMFTLGRLDVLPYLDLGLRKSIMRFYSLKEMPGKEEIERMAVKNSWAPYRSIASWYLWKGLDTDITI